MAKVCVIGVGRIGKLIIKMLEENGHQIVAAVDAKESPLIGKNAHLLAGLEEKKVLVSSCDMLGETIDEAKPDVVVDFSSATACTENTSTVAAKKVNLVIGTTGLTEEQMKKVEKSVSENKVGAVISPNMSVGVNAYWELVRDAARILKGYDIEIIEAHHKFKKDAPSGTALKTAQVICDALGKSLDEFGVYGREGQSPRREGEIGIHAIRAGDIVGEHTVLFSTLGERVEITHRAHSREAFVSGVVKAVDYIVGKKGVYSMKEVLGL
ncbi:MAG: 4-hydroxy-tetrahydrodipicolinate reductase [Candidatus Altiarchaeota archaeon]